jgi:hypothetical protein
MKQLSILQNKEPAFENLIALCRKSPEKIFKKADMKDTTYHYRQGLLVKSHINESTLVRYQIALPRCAVVDLLIILHRKYSHLGIRKLEAKFSEHYFCPNLRQYVTTIISNCYSCQLNLQIPRRRTGDYSHKEKFTLTGPGILFFADCLKIHNHPNALYDYCLIMNCFINFCIG